MHWTWVHGEVAELYFIHPMQLFYGVWKSHVFERSPRDIIELEEKIVVEPQKLKENPALIQRAIRNMVQRAQTCIENDGRHVKGAHG